MSKFQVTILILLFSLAGCTNQSDAQLADNEPTKLQDSDKDGVIDARDICPETRNNLAVTNDGCPVWKEVEEVKELVIFFAVSSTEIKEKYLVKLDELFQYVKDHEGTSILLEGYTSKTGSVETNLRLQEERSHAVKSALVSLGAKPENITIHNQGDVSEHVSIDNKQVHNANQRVYIKIIKLNVEAQDKWGVMTN